MEKEFSLNGHDYIQLNQLLKLLGLVDTGGEANLRIDGGEVKVNDVTETRRRKKLIQGDRVGYNKHRIIIV
jgi:ribosome-associated protein